MTEWVEVNGARIERSFLKENVTEARLYSWDLTRYGEVADHSHCNVCAVALANGDSCYRSEGGWLCLYCFSTFVDEATPEVRHPEPPPDAP